MGQTSEIFKMSTEDYKELRPMDHSFFASVLIAPYLEEFSIFPSLPSFLCILLLLHHVLHPKYLIQCKAGEITSNIWRLFSVEQLGDVGSIPTQKVTGCNAVGLILLFIVPFSVKRDLIIETKTLRTSLLFVLEEVPDL